MLKRWIIYVAVLIGGVVFYCAYQQWFSWLALLGILFLPVAGLVLSLPAMIRLRIGYTPPVTAVSGQPLKVRFLMENFMPSPPVRSRLLVTKANTGEKWLLREGEQLPTDHCGQLVCRPEKAFVYDYMGLFRLRANRKPATAVTVRPNAVPVENVPSLLKHMGKVWRPKPGGGFSEQHEMRLYRPGDKLNQIHWKLSAKTGKTMVREAMEPAAATVQIEMLLRGGPEELDRKFGQMLWLSRYLLEKDIIHYLRVLSGRGILSLRITDETELETAMDTLLAAPCADIDGVMDPSDASWRYRIGGDWDAS